MEDLVKRHNAERSTLLNQIAALQGKTKAEVKPTDTTASLRADLIQKEAQIKNLNEQLKAR